MELKWTKHAIKRGYTRLGRYGMDIIEEKILQNIDNATVSDEDNKAIIEDWLDMFRKANNLKYGVWTTMC